MIGKLFGKKDRSEDERPLVGAGAWPRGEGEAPAGHAAHASHSEPSRPAEPRMTPLEEEAEMQSAEPVKSVAKYEALGQVLVVTVISDTLSGGDARELCGEIAGRSAYGGRQTDTPLPRHFVLDLQNVEYMDSACLGAMVELLHAMQNKGGRIALVNAGRNVEYLFRLTQLDRLFPICRDVMAAIEVVERGAANPDPFEGKKKPKKRDWI